MDRWCLPRETSDVLVVLVWRIRLTGLSSLAVEGLEKSIPHVLECESARDRDKHSLDTEGCILAC